MPTPKYEREIRSMLDKMPSFLGDGGTPGRTPGRPAPRRSPFTMQDWWARDAYIMAALLTVLARFGEPALGAAGSSMLAWLAAALIIFAAVTSVVRAIARPQPPKMWRGNILNYPPRGRGIRLPDWWRRLGGSGPRRF